MQTFFGNMHAFFMTHIWLEFAVRIILASVCGAAIGYERSKRFKEAGIRTLCIVSCVSALLMIISKYGFTDTFSATGEAIYQTDAADPARIAAQIVCGIGFLGAGVIFKTGNSVRGLTTAACIWASASVGMAIGCGMYFLGFFTAVAIVLFQYLLHRFTAGLDGYMTRSLTLTIKKDSDILETITKRFADHRVIVINSCVKRQDAETITVLINTRMTGEYGIADAIRMMQDFPEIESINI